MSGMSRLAGIVADRTKGDEEYNSVCKEISQYWNGDIQKDDLSLTALRIVDKQEDEMYGIMDYNPSWDINEYEGE